MAANADLAILITAQDQASKVIDGLHGSLGKLGGGGGVFSGITSGIGGVVTGMGHIGLAIEGAKVAFEGIKTVATGVFGIGALNELEQVRASFNAFTKDSGKTEQILAQVREEANRTPFAFGEMAKATASLLPVSKSSGQGLMDLVKQAEILAASNPMEGLEGASFSLREAMTGDFTSIIERFNLSRSSINQWKAEGVSNFEIVRRAMAEMGFDSDLIAAKADTLQGRWSTFQDTLTTLSMKMGEPIFDLLKDGLVSVQGALEANMPLLEGMATAVATGITTAITTAKAAFEAWWPTIQQVGTAIQALLDIFLGGDSFDVAAEMLDQVFGPQVTDMILSMVATAGDALRELGSFVLETFGGVVNWFRANWPLIQQTVSVVLAAIAALWREHGETILTVIQAAWTIIKTTIQGALDIVLSLITAAMQLLTGDWEGAWETIVGLLERTGERLMTIIGAAFDAIFAIVDAATGGMLTSIGAWISETAESISSGMQAISDAVSSGWQSVQDFVGGILPAIQSAIMAVWNALPEDIRNDLVLIATHIVTSGAEWVSNVTTAGANMLSAITTALASMVSAVTTWAGEFLAPVTGLVGTSTAAATSVGSGMLSAFTTAFGSIVSAATSWVGQFLAPITGLASSAGAAAASVGQAIVNGITNAISGGIGAIRDMAHRAARAALDAAKSALGINSPSLMFKMEVGRMIPAGIIEGIQAMQRPLDNTLASMIAPPMVPSFAGAGGGTSAPMMGGGLPSIHVYIGTRELQDIHVEMADVAARRARG